MLKAQPAMKPVRHVRTVKVVRWLCSIESHRHLTKQKAADCIKKREEILDHHGMDWVSPQSEVGKMRRLSKLEAIAFWREERHATFREIGERFGLSTSRVNSLYEELIRRRRYQVRELRQVFALLSVICELPAEMAVTQ